MGSAVMALVGEIGNAIGVGTGINRVSEKHSEAKCTQIKSTWRQGQRRTRDKTLL